MNTFPNPQGMHDSPRPQSAASGAYPPGRSFLQLVYGTLFHPVDTFQSTAVFLSDARQLNPLLALAIAITGVVTMLSPLLDFMNRQSAMGSWGNPLLQMPIAGICGIFNWLLIGGLFALLAYGFTGKARYQSLLVLSAFSLIPLLFQLPAILLLSAFSGPLNIMMSLIGLMGGFLAWIWSALLFLLALGVTYDLTVDRTLLVSFSPAILCVLGLVGVITFLMQVFRLVG
ncbi:MAG: Yip1 family protein [Vampirovibrionales bacterium]|nr:Yip1 family protein [Vampirovibrionales bacterium]